MVFIYTLAIDCTHGNVRLIGGLEHTEGRVEMCVQGRWTGVCDSNWNYQDAFVVCRQLGYPATGLQFRRLLLTINRQSLFWTCMVLHYMVLHYVPQIGKISQ